MGMLLLVLVVRNGPVQSWSGGRKARMSFSINPLQML